MYNNQDLNSIKSSLHSIIDTKMLSSIFIKNNKLNIVIELEEGFNIDQEDISQKIKEKLQHDFSDLYDTNIVFSGQRSLAKPVEPQGKTQRHIPNVKKIILLASAKGGVGKSTTATNVAIALAKLGYKTGLVDADIYGPTVPKLLGITQKPEIQDNLMVPIEKYGIHSISIGYLIDETQAAIWRGPMISKTLYQLLLGVKWPELDYLIIDMPPGTGDIYLSLAENFKVDGAILLTTPQNIALSMLKKSVTFFNKTNIPILGIIENMSYFFDPINNITHNIFGDSNIASLKLDMFEKIPLIPKISKYADNGKSIDMEEEFSYYLNIAKKLSEKLQKLR